MLNCRDGSTLQKQKIKDYFYFEGIILHYEYCKFLYVQYIPIYIVKKLQYRHEGIF
jgi:hypothetical protein